MPYISLEEHLPGVTGLLEYRKDAAQSLRELTQLLLRGPSLANDEILRRQVPNYFGEHKFALEDVRLVFKSTRPNYVRHGMSKAVEAFVNSSRRRTEKFEARWCYLWPAYEISYVIRRLPERAPRDPR